MDTLIPAAGMFAAALQTGSGPLDASRSAMCATYTTALPSPQRSIVYPYGNATYRDAVSALARISTYQENWDSYGGHAVSLRAVDVGKRLLGMLSDDLPRVDVVPSSSGGIQFEWQTAFAEVEIFIAPDGVINISRTSPDGVTTEMTATIGQSSRSALVFG